MKKILAVLGTLAFCVAVAGCGGGNACQQACEKLKSCANACDSADPGCAILKASLGKADCNAGGGGECSGQAQTAADTINKCSLDPKTCACK